MRFRLTPALVIGCMANGTLAKSVDEELSSTIDYLRPPNLLPYVTMEAVQVQPGCRSAGCRTLAHCICGCKRCKKECRVF